VEKSLRNGIVRVNCARERRGVCNLAGGTPALPVLNFLRIKKTRFSLERFHEFTALSAKRRANSKQKKPEAFGFGFSNLQTINYGRT
jgi:hypothetical protein